MWLVKTTKILGFPLVSLNFMLTDCHRLTVQNQVIIYASIFVTTMLRRTEQVRNIFGHRPKWTCSPYCKLMMASIYFLKKTFNFSQFQSILFESHPIITCWWLQTVLLCNTFLVSGNSFERRAPKKSRCRGMYKKLALIFFEAVPWERRIFFLEGDAWPIVLYLIILNQ